MAPVTNASNGLSYLTQPGGLLSNLPSAIPASALQSATPQDLVSISDAALQLQTVDGLFGAPSTGQSSSIGLPVLSPSSSNVLPGVSSADLSNATPQQQAVLNNQALLLQQTQELFNPPATTGTVNLIG